jgi:hypothetical protein
LSQIVVGGIAGEAILIELNLGNVSKEDGVLSAVFCSFKDWRRIHNSSITALFKANR